MGSFIMNSEPKKILVIDDEPQIVSILRMYLEKSGFNVVTAEDGLSALSVFHQANPDFLILDLNLPGMDGLDVCRTIRRESNVPILMLTARLDETDKLIGLELGADDYMVKPFSPKEVVARVRTILRRTNFQEPVIKMPIMEKIQIGDLSIDPEQHTIFMDEKPIELTHSEFDILLVLARQPKRVFSRLQIMEQAQGEAFEEYERAIDAHIKNIRNKLEPDPRKPTYIHTVFGVGYKLEAVNHA